jgi:hypothetical protein
VAGCGRVCSLSLSSGGGRLRVCFMAREKRKEKLKKYVRNTQYSILNTQNICHISNPSYKNPKHKTQTSNITIVLNEIYARGLEVRKSV